VYYVKTYWYVTSPPTQFTTISMPVHYFPVSKYNTFLQVVKNIFWNFIPCQPEHSYSCFKLLYRHLQDQANKDVFQAAQQ